MKKSDAKAILIDDDLEFCGIFQKALETVAVRADFSVELAYRDRIEDDDQEIEDYDIYFVDIELGEKSGIELVAGMQRRNPGKEFIFVSAHEGYVWKSMLAKPRYFIRKRTLEADLLEAVSFLKKLWWEKHARVKVGGAEVCPRTVLWCGSKDHYVDIHQEDGSSILLRARLGQLEELFSEYHYIRIHNRLMVNLEYVDRFKGNQVILKDSTVLQASRAYQKKVQEGLGKWFEGLYRKF
jgi:DNA-binding LytR/AlgR family response regulator